MYNARLKLTITSPPQTFSEPLMVSDVTEFTRIPDADTTRDTLITSLIVAAREIAELRQCRDLVTKQWTMTLDCFPGEYFQLRDNLSTVEELKYRDSTGAWTTLVEDTDYLVDTGRFIVTPIYGGAWPSFTPWPTSAVSITYTVVPPSVDAQVLQGMKWLIKEALESDSPLAAIGSGSVVYPFTYSLLDHGRSERL